jgi:hypothetical protein
MIKPSNFREIRMGSIAPGMLYRSSHPIQDGKQDRAIALLAGNTRIATVIKSPRRKQRGIEDFSLKSLRMRGNKSPIPPVLTAPRGGELNP